jgi:hypothetical protein
MLERTSAATGHRTGGDHVDAYKRQNVTYRFATESDLRRFYGDLPRPTVRAVVILLDGEPVGVIGLARESGCEKLFSEYKPEMQPHLRRFEVLRAIKLAMTLVESAKCDVYAVRDEGTDILLRLGFEHVEDDIYKWPSFQQHCLT